MLEEGQVSLKDFCNTINTILYKSGMLQCSKVVL